MRMGLGRVRLYEWDDNQYVTPTFHFSGTTRMASDPRVGVVDADCRVHSTRNLFVAGSSVFPTVGHVNPTLTIVALACRLADHLVNRAAVI